MFENSIRQWISGHLSEATSKTNNLPRCPFAKPALEKGTVVFSTAHKADDVWTIIEQNAGEWDEDERQAVVIHLDWDVSNQERIRLCKQANTFYGVSTEKLFIEEFRILDGTPYHMILMHDFVEMQNAKRTLKKQGYYNH